MSTSSHYYPFASNNRTVTARCRCCGRNFKLSFDAAMRWIRRPPQQRVCRNCHAHVGSCRSTIGFASGQINPDTGKVNV